MSTYYRASAITGLNDTLFGGVGDTEGSRADTSIQGGARFGMTRRGELGDGEAGPEVRAKVSRPKGRNVELSRNEVGDDGGD